MRAARRRRGSPTSSRPADTYDVAVVARLNYSRLSDRLLAGAMPHSEAHVDALVAEGVDIVINLCELREYWVGEREAVVAAYRAAGIRELHLPVKDGATVPGPVIDAAVREHVEGVAYVHCRGGRERSATVATAILAASHQLSVGQALAMAQLGRPVFQPLPWQLAALHAWGESRMTD
jgi:atypical dual specificity phosphatase